MECVVFHQAVDVEQMLVYSWASVVDTEATLKQHWVTVVNASCSQFWGMLCALHAVLAHPEIALLKLTRCVDPMLAHFWNTVFGPALTPHRINVSY